MILNKDNQKSKYLKFKGKASKINILMIVLDFQVIEQIIIRVKQLNIQFPNI